VSHNLFGPLEWSNLKPSTSEVVLTLTWLRKQIQFPKRRVFIF
jgi:hypothetical protein